MPQGDISLRCLTALAAQHDASVMLRLLLLLAGLSAAAASGPALQPLTPGAALLSSPQDGSTLVTAPGSALQGALRGSLQVNGAGDCAAACTQDPECSWANFCAHQVRLGAVGGPGLSGRAAAAAAAAGPQGWTPAWSMHPSLLSFLCLGCLA